MYFNYHAKVKRLIKEGEVVKIEFFKSYNKISPAMVIYFKNNPPMPIREHKWEEYLKLLNETNFIEKE